MSDGRRAPPEAVWGGVLNEPPLDRCGPYWVTPAVAAGGMATVHLGCREVGDPIVAVKRLRRELADAREFVEMFLDEARMTRLIRHPNVVETFDVVASGSDPFIVMEYVHGDSLAYLLRAARASGERTPLPIAGAILAGVLAGLHAAHEVRAEDGQPMDLIHRDVSPQNILVGVDGTVKLVDFGVAKARGRRVQTQHGIVKGKLQYMSPEQIKNRPLDRRSDVFSAGIVWWEMLTGRELFAAEDDVAVLYNLLRRPIPSPSVLVGGLPGRWVEAASVALDRDPERRYPTSRAMARVVDAQPIADRATVGRWVRDLSADRLDRREHWVERLTLQASGVHPTGSLDDDSRRSGERPTRVTPFEAWDESDLATLPRASEPAATVVMDPAVVLAAAQADARAAAIDEAMAERAAAAGRSDPPPGDK